MKREVVITPRAKIEVEEIFNYLEAKWNNEVKRKFSNKINFTIQLIVKNPELFPISSINKKIRKVVISKQTSLFYHFNIKHIVIVSVFDTRQNPNKLKDLK
ncbi:type II toxin-antitoxin system RelE/ParE family toxin [Flavobacterium sufflavum]|uniref:Type II toxin-antitoxin system RelE/ParE family toxin n=1 Tax=Flavobacterium sufflavum TaxID=1921138 RepID=A0A437L2K8_9FLAO|nr:type II toxin-antitoxin system RelE/ParE family toxin [Flavobacterium sufflavum]RVT79548.1 type II toxin-antitoxin system RelE/ParE family toxin [Flavobacterium sufflavum]